MNPEFVVKNENDAWDLLEKALKDGIPDGPFELTFDSWPVLEFRLKGEKFDSSMTTKVMQSFIDLQKDINNAYAQLKYNKPNSVGLLGAERQELEIVVKVEKGSSVFKVDLQPAVETLLQGIAGKMTGTEIVVSVLGVSLIAGGVVAFKAYLNSQQQQKQIEALPLLSKQETERLKIFAGALQRQEKLVPIYEDAQETYNSILKGAREAYYLEIGGKKILQEDIEELVRKKRSLSEEVQLNGMYRILKVDSSKPEGFLVEVQSQEDSRTFTAKLEDKWVFRKTANLERLKDAEWGKEPIYLRINGKELRGAITQATILDVGKES